MKKKPRIIERKNLVPGERLTVAVDELSELSLFRVFKVFLESRKKYAFSVFPPYMSPLEEFLRLVTMESWKVSCDRAEGQEKGQDFRLPKWAARFMERLVRVTCPPKSIQEGEFKVPIIFGEEALNILGSVVNEKAAKPVAKTDIQAGKDS